jgi:hypothetical protein
MKRNILSRSCSDLCGLRLELSSDLFCGVFELRRRALTGSCRWSARNMFSAYDLREKLLLARFRAQERVACSLYKLYKLYKAIYAVRRALFWDRRVQEFQNSTWRTGAVGSLGTPLGDLSASRPSPTIPTCCAFGSGILPLSFHPACKSCS